MRTFLVGSFALLAAACTSTPTETAATEGCTRTATHEAAWSNEAAPDIVGVRAEGPTCAQAIVTFVVRNAEGDPLWTFASTYYDMTIGGRSDGRPVAPEAVDGFLASWADVTLNRSGALPEWREGAESLSSAAEGMSYFTELDRETYEGLRARNLPQLCFAAAVEATQCLVIDPMSGAPIVIVAFGV